MQGPSFKFIQLCELIQHAMRSAFHDRMAHVNGKRYSTSGNIYRVSIGANRATLNVEDFCKQFAWDLSRTKQSRNLNPVIELPGVLFKDYCLDSTHSYSIILTWNSALLENEITIAAYIGEEGDR